MKYQDFKFFTKIPAYNDEYEMTTGLLGFDDAKCKRCGICGFICPARSIIRDGNPGGWRNGLPRLITMAKGVTECIACGCCVAACPEQAINIQRQFNPGYFFHRLTQTDRMTYPKLYSEADLPPAEPAPSSAGASPKQRAHRKINWTYKRRQLALLKAALSAFMRITLEEIREGRIVDDIRARRRGETNDISWAQLLETRARRNPDKIFLYYENETFTFRQMDDNANRMANFLLKHGGGKGKGLGIFMKNSPRFLDLFFGAQKIGMYLVPINPELKGEGLSYIINHSDIESLVLDAELIPSFQTAAGEVENLRRIFIDDVDAEAEKNTSGIPLAAGMMLLSPAYAMVATNPGVGCDPEDMCLIIYTSGTTGRPKGVVYRYKKSSVKLLSFYAHVLLREDDIYYTCLPLCHGNALFITTTMSLARGGSMVLSRKFSASRFFETIGKTGATVFNTIGSIIPILMKQPEKASDRQHHVRMVFSAACPVDMWQPFEVRFGVKLYEAYGAVDGGGKGIMNLGTAPVGSLGKPANPKIINIVDAAGNPVPENTPGELLFKIKMGGSAVEYYKNEEASRRKSSDGWLHTGDLVRQDADGFIYFVGRNTESMRKGGENVSAYEVEHVIMAHPAVEEVAVYAVPSDMNEDEIMAAVKRVNGHELTAAEIRAFLANKLARYAVPRYIRFVDDFPKTTSHRIIKKPLEDEGVTADTDDGNLTQ